MNYRFLRSECRLPPAQLNHIELALSFYEDRIESAGTLTLTARETLRSLELDAKALDIHEVSLPYTCDRERNKLTVTFPEPVEAGTTFTVSARCTIHPSDTILDGIYRDAQPKGVAAPQQYMSQCQQWGFQRIFPVIDDCTAKCTFRTTLEGDARYTHLLSNGDVDRTVNPDGLPVPKPGDPSRKVITYVNPVPMAPYLFLACAGTWDVLADEAVYPEGKRIRLEYLVPPGRADGARIPMEITKRSVLWQHEYVGYTYPYECYRTITMEKSNYGGMENVGNTTIITEAALIDGTTGDNRLIYAHGVIPHEYEHNHCGSGVTMTTPFDMWLNEAYTVNVERAFLQTVFDPTFLRLRDVAGLREPGNGAMAMEETGKFGQIVREGFNDPDEVVDAVTYDKAPEVLDMLERLIGRENYRKATDLYFTRYNGGNADTGQFLSCVAETVPSFDIARFADGWLFHAGYPRVTVSYEWKDGLLRLSLRQTSCPETAKGPFLLPFPFAGVSADGRDLLENTIAFDTASAEFVFPCPEAPAYLSLNRDAAFYGTCTDLQETPATLALQARTDPCLFNRVEAFRRLTDLERIRFLKDEAGFAPSPDWLRVFCANFADTSLPDGVKAALLSVGTPLDRSLLANVRENPRFRRAILREAAKTAGVAALVSALGTGTPDSVSAAVERRALRASLLRLLAALDTQDAWEALEAFLEKAAQFTDRINALAALWESSSPRAALRLAQARTEFVGRNSTYLGYLSLLGSAPREEAFEAVAREAETPEFSYAHPGLCRSLLCPLAQNDDLVWTERGLAWLADTCVRLAPVNEYTTLRILGVCQNHKDFAPDLKAAVRAALIGIRDRLADANCPWFKSTLETYLETSAESDE